MANEYVKRTKAARKQADKWTKKTVERCQKVIADSIDELNRSLLDRKPGSLSERWAKEYIKSLEKEYGRIMEEITKIMEEGIRAGARSGTKVSREVLEEAFKDSGLDLDKSFKTMFARVEDSVVRRIMEGDFYVDNKTLSDRVWNFTNGFGKDIQNIVSQGLIQQKSAVNMAKDLRTFVKPPEKRPLSWRGDYKSYAAKHADYVTMRLARTSINHAHQNATIASCQNNPFIDSVEWLTSGHHVCPVCQDREGKIYKLDDVPVDHPNGKCALAPVIDRDMRDIGREINEWLKGGENEKLDRWYTGILADDLLNKYKNVEPKVTNDLLDITKNTGGKLEGLDYRLKSKDSLTRKILSDSAETGLSLKNIADGITDVLRYTIVHDEEDFTQLYFDTVYNLEKSGYNKIRIRNTFKDNVEYKGVNTLLKDTDGNVFELQYHTPKSYDIKEGGLHDLYERYRLLDSRSAEAIKLKQDMVDLSNTISIPKFVEKIK